MLKSKFIMMDVSGSAGKWYKEKGYKVPERLVQLYYTNKKGEKRKNGVEKRVKRNTQILVNVKDLPPSSNKTITFICKKCGKKSTTSWGAYKSKLTNKCTFCQKKTIKVGCQDYWVNKLISGNKRAICDISGETDKRFLVLHHLRSRRNKGKNTPKNYKILSANYHLAFHNWNGGMNIRCTPEQYYEFKKSELKRIKNSK